MVTVRNLLELPALRDLKVVAGKQGLDRPVEWFHIVDFPHFLPFMEGEILLFTTGYAFSQNMGLTKNLIEELVAKRMAGLVIANNLYLNGIPSNICLDADEYGFPIIEIPPGVYFSIITREIATCLFLDRLKDRLAAWVWVNREMSRAALKQDLDSVTKLLHTAGHMEVAIIDVKGQILAIEWSDTQNWTEIVHVVIKDIVRNNQNQDKVEEINLLSRDLSVEKHWQISVYVLPIFNVY
ncbi:MAG: hypothetical protein GXX10_00675, partial [Clostridiaceae bacterium]|nr:hypothetical protein [Clostridiaceae bacterium]